MPRKPPWFLALGAVTGLLSAVATLLPLPEAPAPRLFGFCFGINSPGGRCEGLDASVYLFPGLIFGVGFAAAQTWRGRFGAGRAIAFLLASTIANAIAVFFCLGLFMLFSDLTDITFLDAPLALAGAIAGAIGGGLLSVATARLVPGVTVCRSIIVATLLGLLVPLVTELQVAGIFLFYIVWQAGYSLALASGLPRRS